ncbi:hypothetical protein SD37_24575 [Amycolatopsis orientalis]|uniref:Uncharacterized protein n=1 Tax=Amycolatopsis orientalis TaxID=31958 RepID=A0A193C1T7_AMYOR|nr:hypothetical protein [Amycolatopsis orientalis]ANN18486.1 hypothetical protein SD37_24575 [Amycolatopsis orientalis]
MPLELATAVAAPAAAADIRCTDVEPPVTGPLGEPATVHGGMPFEKVVIVGHPDVDCGILAGITHLPSEPASTLGSDPLYFVTKPEARAGLFSATENTDPGVIEADEATKDQVSVPGMGTVAVCSCSGTARAAGRPAEAPFYGPEAELSTYVLPGAEHSPALHRNVSLYRDTTREWMRDKVVVALP